MTPHPAPLLIDYPLDPSAWVPVKSHVRTIQVRIPPEELGNVTGLLSRKRGSIHNVEQSGPAVTVTGMVPVSETLGLSQEMRAATSGSAFWQSTFDHWSPVPPTLLSDTVRKVRTRKGMEPDPPHANLYIVRE